MQCGQYGEPLFLPVSCASIATEQARVKHAGLELHGKVLLLLYEALQLAYIDSMFKQGGVHREAAVAAFVELVKYKLADRGAEVWLDLTFSGRPGCRLALLDELEARVRDVVSKMGVDPSSVKADMSSIQVCCERGKCTAYVYVEGLESPHMMDVVGFMVEHGIVERLLKELVSKPECLEHARLDYTRMVRSDGAVSEYYRVELMLPIPLGERAKGLVLEEQGPKRIHVSIDLECTESFFTRGGSSYTLNMRVSTLPLDEKPLLEESITLEPSGNLFMIYGYPRRFCIPP